MSVISYYGVSPHGTESAICEAVQGGAELIFTTSVSLIDATLRVAVRYPKVRFMNCSIDQPYVNVKALLLSSARGMVLGSRSISRTMRT